MGYYLNQQTTLNKTSRTISKHQRIKYELELYSYRAFFIQ
ncbi:MAG: hypothetical protein OFPII_09350 [Osedax symbiont Rs1]|nr:MAG: hypothetical protein OFPII_09350 [Osedax symbiont Rs1]